MNEHNIFYVPPDCYAEKEVLIRGSQLRHVRNVLRKKRGDNIFLTDGLGNRYRVGLTALVGSEMRAEILGRERMPRKCSVQITVGFVPVKGLRNDAVIEKCTELGVARFIIFLSERSVLKNIGAQKLARFAKVAQSAMIQSQQCYLPDILYAPGIADMLEFVGHHERIFVADSEGEARVQTGAGKILLLIGPEGGFTDEERDFFLSRGASLLSLGNTRLRSETAALVGVAKILTAYGEI
jgi:16S rRNA (uracil1498-N3)-methyltransferase